MNWQEIAEKYPKAFEEYRKIIPNDFCAWRGIEYHWGLILKFFDSKGIIIKTDKSGRRMALSGGKNWYYDISGYTKVLGYDIIASSENDCVYYFSRPKAQQAATIKAFSILEEEMK